MRSLSGHLALLLQIHLKVDYDALALQIPNLNAGLGGSAEPIPVRAKAERMNNGACVQRVKPLSLSQIPEQNHSIFAPAGAQRAVGRHGHRVHIPRVASEGGAQLAVGQIPNLYGLIPRAGNNGGANRVGGEPNTRNPIGMGVLILNSVLALAEGVPQLDRLVAGGGDDLAIINGECDGEDVLGVSDEAAGGGAGLEVPEAELAVPRAGQGELAVGGEDDVLDEVRVAGEAAAGHAVRAVLLCEGPEDDGLIAGGGDDHVGVVYRGGDGSHPVGVGAHGAAEDKLLLCHCRWGGGGGMRRPKWVLYRECRE